MEPTAAQRKPEYRDVSSVMTRFPFPGKPEFGKDLRACRLELGLTQKDVGKMVGVSQQTVQQWECGRLDKKRHGGRCVSVRTWPAPDWSQLQVLVDRLGLGAAEPAPLEELDEDCPQKGMYSLRFPWTEEDERREQRRIDELPARTRQQRNAKWLAEAMRHSDLRLRGFVVDRKEYECLVHIKELNPDYPISAFKESIATPCASRRHNIERRMHPDVEGESGWVTMWNQPAEGMRRGYNEEFGDLWHDLLALVGFEEFDATCDRDIMEFCLRVLGLFGMRGDALEGIVPATRDGQAYDFGYYVQWSLFSFRPNNRIIAVLRERIELEQGRGDIGNEDGEDEEDARSEEDVLADWACATAQLEHDAWEMSEAYRRLEQNPDFLHAYKAACSDDAGVFEDYPNGNEYEPSAVNRFLCDCASEHRHPWDDISALVISEQRKWREARLQEAAETLRNRIDWELGEILSMS